MLRQTVITLILLILPTVATGQQAANADSAEPVRTWTVGVQEGFTNTFQLTLGGTYGLGSDWQNRVTVSLNNLWRDGDNLNTFGSTFLDVTTGIVNWQAGMMYKNRVLKTRHHALVLGGGFQRWLLPSVKTGAQDWLVSGSLAYNTRVKKLPISINQDSWTLLRSTLPTGSALYTQIHTQHTLVSRKGFNLALKHGPHYTYAWGFYGAYGNRVFRYAGLLVANWKGYNIEGGCRQQFGLQDRIPYNRFWSILVTRQLTRPLAFWKR